ncbi:hemicentin-2 [Sabethes cyaneus]|uniref:hemicentin-2 n=1 Tax=Sabethes cyaneus TaxID=53552 RepID=UPI00237D5C26|nr:hemicentin-2 [Sabethes cyaneus]
MACLDIEKAFDNVWHDGLIHKLVLYNFPNYLVKIIQSYLRNRRSQVCVLGELSDPFNVPAGVPQGSILGPVLYNLFTSDIPDLPGGGVISLFADDTAILYAGRQIKPIVKKLQDGLNCFAEYLAKWKIRVNAAKTQTIVFPHRNSQRLEPSTLVQLNGASISWSTDVRYLGLTYDRKLLYRLHIDQTVARSTVLLKKLYPLINRKSKLSAVNKLAVYKQVVRPMLLYAAPIWRACAKTHLLKVHRVQNKFLKMILNLPPSTRTSEVQRLASIDSTLVLLWRRGTNVLTASQLMVTRDERIRLVNGYNLEISELEPQDAGDYVCQISDKINKDQVHTVEILVPPSVRAIPPSGQLTARKGGAVTLECKASGNPVPSIYWTKRSGAGKSAAKIGEGPILTLERVERQQAGVYQCTADNNVGDPVTVDMRLDVLYPPDISVDKSWIHSGEGFEAQLECIVHADPQPTVSWYQNSFPIQPTDRRTMSSRGNRHTLTIRHVQQEDFGNYSCVADNTLGRSKKYMEVSGRPGPAEFVSPPWSRSPDSYNLTWKVESYPPLLEVRLLYRKLMMNETFQQPGRWHDVILTPSPRPISEPLTHVMAFTLRGLLPSSVYESIVQAKNRYGWNEVSDIFQFYTQRISSDIHSEEMQVASSTSRSGAATLHRIQAESSVSCLMMTATVVCWLLVSYNLQRNL